MVIFFIFPESLTIFACNKLNISKGGRVSNTTEMRGKTVIKVMIL